MMITNALHYYVQIQQSICNIVASLLKHYYEHLVISILLFVIECAGAFDGSIQISQI